MKNSKKKYTPPVEMVEVPRELAVICYQRLRGFTASQDKAIAEKSLRKNLEAHGRTKVEAYKRQLARILYGVRKR